MGPIYLFMERSFEPPAQFEQVELERGGRSSLIKCDGSGFAEPSHLNMLLTSH